MPGVTQLLASFSSPSPLQTCQPVSRAQRNSAHGCLATSHGSKSFPGGTLAACLRSPASIYIPAGIPRAGKASDLRALQLIPDDPGGNRKQAPRVPGPLPKAPPPSLPRIVLRDIKDLPSLAEVVERHAAAWSQGGDVDHLWAAFARVGQLGSQPGADPGLARRCFLALGDAYLPLVPSLHTAMHCVTPIWVAAKLDCWDHRGLVTALLCQLGADPGDATTAPPSSTASASATTGAHASHAGALPASPREAEPSGATPAQPWPGPPRRPLLYGASGQGHSNLWWALSAAPPDIAVLGAVPLDLSAARLMALPGPQLDDQHCAVILLATHRLRPVGRSPDEALVRRLTACLTAKPDADCQALANTIYSLGQLARECGHVPQLGDLRRLSERVLQRLGEGAEAGAVAGEPQRPGAMEDWEGRLIRVRVKESEVEGRGQGQRRQQQRRRGGEGEGGGGPEESMVGGFTGQELSNMLLGVAELGDTVPLALPPALAVAAAAAAAAGGMNAQALSNSLYALAKMGYGGGAAGAAAPLASHIRTLGALCAAARQRLRERPGEFVSQNIANLLWALRKLQPPGGLALGLAEDLAAECGRRGFRGMAGADLANTVSVLARMGWADQGWYAAAVVAACRPGVMAGAGVARWAALWSALAAVRHRPAKRLLAVMLGTGPGDQGQPHSEAEGTEAAAGAAGAAAVARGASAGSCSELLWALAALGLWSEVELVDALARQLRRLLRLNPDWLPDGALGRVLWALAAMGPGVLRRQAGLVEGLLREAVWRWEAARTGGPGRRGINGPRVLQQLWQVQLELEHMEAGSGSSIGGWSEGSSGGGGGGDDDGDEEDELEKDGGVAGGDGGGGEGGVSPGPKLSLILAACEPLLADARAASEWAAASDPHDPTVEQLRQEVVASLRQLHERLAEATADPGQTSAPAWDSGGSGGGSGRSRGWHIVAVDPDYWVPELGCRVDVRVRLRGRREAAVLVGGPGSYLANEPHGHRETGGAALRGRQLGRVFGEGGVVRVPYWEWAELLDERERRLYLAELLGVRVPRGWRV